MVTISLQSIIIASVLLVVGLVFPLVNVFFRRVQPRKEQSDFMDGDSVDESASSSLPPVSVVITSHNNAEELERNLPLFLTQEYQPGFEVIVVVEKGEDDTDDALTRLKAQYPNLYTTYVPESSRYVSRKKLAVTLGVKAAHHEWIALTDATCQPRSEQWLRMMASQTADGVDLVSGYANYDDSTGAFKRFLSLMRQLYLLRRARLSTAYRQEGCNLMFRKSVFMQGKGFEGNLKYIGGLYDFIVNKYAHRGRTAVCLQPEAWLTDANPAGKRWKNLQLFHFETRRHLRRTAIHRLTVIADLLALHLGYIACVAGIVWAALTEDWLVLSASVVAFIITVGLRTLFLSRQNRRFRVGIATWRLPFMELAWVWHHLYYRMRYALADKKDFISHKV